MAAVFAIALTPSSVLADANPNNHGHHYHYGWANHHSPPPAPAPPPGGGPGTSGPHNSIVAAVPVALTGQAPTDLAPAAVPPETPVLAPPDLVPTAQPVLAGSNAWLVAILLATLVAANVTLLVLAASRGGHFALRRALAPVGIRV